MSTVCKICVFSDLKNLKTKKHQNVIVGCRLCLCQNTARNFFSLSLSAREEFSYLQSALGLEADFSQLDGLPNHVCGVCKKFRLMAMDNERFLIISQEAVKTYGLEAARELFENKIITYCDSQDIYLLISVLATIRRI